MAATEKTPLVAEDARKRWRNKSFEEDLENSDSITSSEKSHGDGPFGFASAVVIYMSASAVACMGGVELANQYFLKNTLLLGPAEVAAVMSTHSLGWVIKPVWGLVTDSYPIGGQRRKPYLMLISLLAASGFICYAFVDRVWQFIAVLVLTHACMAFLTVIAQALLVQRSSEGDIRGASFNFSSYFGTKTIVWGLSAYAAGYMLQHQSPRRVLMSTALAFVALAATASFMKEPPSAEKQPPMQQLRMVMSMFKKREVWGTSLYIFVFCAIPKPTAAMFFFSVDVLHFSSQFMAVITMATSIAYLCGLLFYHFCLTGTPFRTLFGAATVFCTVISLTPLIQVFRLNRAWGIDDHVFALVDTFVISVVVEILWIPMLVLASRLCPGAVEGTTYALFLSIHNLGLWVSGTLSGVLTWALGITRHDLSNLWLLVVICALGTLLPLPLLVYVPKVDPQELREGTGDNPQAA